MAMCQNQIQEDFVFQCDLTSRAKGNSIQKSSPSDIDNVTDTAEDAKPMKLDHKDFMGQFDNSDGDTECDLCDTELQFWQQEINVGIERGIAFLTNLLDKQLQHFLRFFERVKITTGNYVHDLPKCEEVLKVISSVCLFFFGGGWVRFLRFFERVQITTGNHVHALPKCEEVLKVISSVCLFFFGGGWVRLASMIAVAELFDTKKVLEEAFVLSWKFMSVEHLDHNEDVTPFQLTMTMRNVGMHFALFLAVVNCGAWAGICISFAFASKLSTIFRLEEFLDDGTGVPNFYSACEVEWLSIISDIISATISLIVLGMAPGFITAMYMALIGIQFFFTGQYRLCLPSGSFTSKPYVFLTSEDFLNSRHQFSIWASVTFTAFWQALYSYDSTCQYFSWLMFLLPAVKCFNLMSGYFTFDMEFLM